jgi:hypothetical protein
MPNGAERRKKRRDERGMRNGGMVWKVNSEHQYQVYKVFIIKIKLNTESLKLDFTV